MSFWFLILFDSPCKMQSLCGILDWVVAPNRTLRGPMKLIVSTISRRVFAVMALGVGSTTHVTVAR